MTAPFRFDKMPYSLVAAALAAAGMPEGKHHRGSGWSDWGDLEYEPPVAGFVVSSRRSDPSSGVNYNLYVDHAGKGRKKALPDYAAALASMGFKVHVAPLHDLTKKTVLWIDEVPANA